MREADSSGLTNPLLDLELPTEFRELRPFRRKLEALVERRIESGDISHMSIYFRDLNNGPWFGVNERERFLPASLFKVPIMIAVLKETEEYPGLLDRSVDSGRLPEDTADQNVPPGQRVESGRAYTLLELLRLMIAHSDNRARNLVLGYVEKKVFDEVFTDLGLPPPLETEPDPQMHVKGYSTFFRILYNASYLSRRMSALALQILTETTFKDGLVAGVPEGVKVAHKFGERGFADRPERQLHDCGIVYHPRTPYVLCVMTRGDSIPDQAAAIREASALVYGEVDAQARAAPLRR